jgi:RHH-type proline utilization regulon transcriptional repressor/proline dehydrogenase/delta 1-pyrroline-5-carboxylate dehydrogenase
MATKLRAFHPHVLHDDALTALLDEFKPDEKSSLDGAVQRALVIARALQSRAQELQTPHERKQQMELDRMIQNPNDKVTLTQLTDQAFRSKAAARSADQLIHILDVQGVPRFFNPIEQTLLRGFQSFGNYLPGVAVPLVKDQMRRETANVILPAEQEILRKHLQERREEGVRMNVNFLGEAILGQAEAQRRLNQYLAALQLPEIEVVSVKISTIYSQIQPIERDKSIAHMCDAMELLYRASSKESFTRIDGSVVPKFVYLDMEEYRDLSLTADVFMQTLDRLGLKHISAGIVLQAYIPDSYPMQQRISAWARQRVASGGAPVTLRIVKGANMEMERVDASLHGWPQAPFKTKIETDSNYKRMVQFAMQRENHVAVRPGIASHNLFDLSYALVLTMDHQAWNEVQFEMLEGMANHQRRALHELTRNVLLYAPACKQHDFIHAIGYLVRRLDENTGEENFLRHAFQIKVNSPAWKRLETGFVKSFELIEQLPSEPRRTQDRAHEQFTDPTAIQALSEFDNEPDTDFSLVQNSGWAKQIVANWIDRHGEQAMQIPLWIAGQEVTEPREEKSSYDPSRPGTVVARYPLANADDAQRALACAVDDPAGWRTMSFDERHLILRRAATELRRARADLMGAAIAEAGKTLLESDPEVSEAIDFCDFYPASTQTFKQLDGVSASGRGVCVVVSPWNFPIAIPCGGVAAALSAGNTVILKPASSTVMIAHLLCECFYRAGVPRTALQFVPCSGRSVGQQIVADPRVDVVVLTGGTETAIQMLEQRPEMNLLAETGGKNATIVTALADRDQAIKHVIHSAFSHCGQKCSATSLLLLEEEVFDDERFRETLIDAVKSLPVGSAWNLKNKLGPLIEIPTGDLERGLKELETGESWALMPQDFDDNPQLFTPGIKWNSSPGSYTHCTEFFGPVLSVMKFKSLAEAIQIVNQTGYGLTSGLESLDDREQKEWRSGIRAGNLYINRPTTGAIVLRQPFGGFGKSVFGPGIKAGGPNYVSQLMRFQQTGKPTGDGEIRNENLKQLAADLQQFVDSPIAAAWKAFKADDVVNTVSAIESYDWNAFHEFNRQHDTFRLVGQDNMRRYLPVEIVCIRIVPSDSLFEIFARVAAAHAAGCRVLISVDPDVDVRFMDLLDELTETWAADIEFIEEDDDRLASAIQAGHVLRLRYANPERVPQEIRRAVTGKFVHIADTPVLSEGRIELLWYLQEQSISFDYHRYGNLGKRALERRRPIL